MNTDANKRTGRSWAVGWGVLLAGMAILAVHAWHYMPFLADDALISLRYAQRLLQGHGLTWTDAFPPGDRDHSSNLSETACSGRIHAAFREIPPRSPDESGHYERVRRILTDGRPVEGYSNLFWVLLAAMVGRCGLDLVVGLRLLGFASAAMLLGAVVYGHRARSLGRAAAMVLGVLTVALAGPIAIWTIGGLEAILVAALLAWAVVLCYPIFEREEVSNKVPLVASVPLALLCITRPDGALFTATIVFAVFLTRGVRRRTFGLALRLAALPVAFYLGQLAFRLAYYGEWVPNTALVKIAPSAKHVAQGVFYVKEGFFALGPISAVAVVLGLFLLTQRVCRPKAVLLVVPAIAWAAYIASVGGDTFPGWRHMVPLVPLMALMLAQGIERLMERASRHLVSVLLVLAVALGMYAHRQFHDQRNRLVLSERWEWDGQVVGHMLKRGFGSSQPLLAAAACGCLPYWSELPALDMLGLNDYYLPRHRPDDFGQGTLSHELGDGQYVLDRRPELIIFGGPRGLEKAHFLSGRQMQQKPEFYELYTPVTFEGREPHTVQSLIWVRRYGEKIGIRTTDSKVTVPGYLLNGEPETVAYLDQSGRFVVALTPERPVSIKGLIVPRGRWQIEVDASGEVAVSVRSSGDGAVLLEKTTGAFQLGGKDGARVDVTLQTDAKEPIEVRGLSFVRSQTP